MRFLAIFGLCVLFLAGSGLTAAQAGGQSVYRPGLGSPEVYTIGDGVTSPRLVKRVRPTYTAEAKQAGIQGNVTMDCVVLPDGTVGDVRVTKKLDPGLDEEAIKTLRRWRFRPAQKDGKPVPVQVFVEMSFTLR